MKAGKRVEARERVGQEKLVRERVRERGEKVGQECVGREWGKRTRESGVSEIGRKKERGRRQE